MSCLDRKKTKDETAKDNFLWLKRILELETKRVSLLKKGNYLLQKRNSVERKINSFIKEIINFYNKKNNDLNFRQKESIIPDRRIKNDKNHSYELKDQIEKNNEQIYHLNQEINYLEVDALYRNECHCCEGRRNHFDKKRNHDKVLEGIIRECSTCEGTGQLDIKPGTEDIIKLFPNLRKKQKIKLLR